MDAIDDAKAVMKKHAASALARKEELEGQLEKLLAQRAELDESRAAAESAGATELLAEIDEVRGTLGLKIESMEEQIAIAANTVDDVVQQMNDLEGSRSTLERDSLMAKVQALSTTDGFSVDPVDRALANVRDHAASLDAEAGVADVGLDPQTRAKLRQLEEDKKEAGLRAQLEALKAKKREASAPKDDDDDDDPLKKPKRTM